MRMQCNKVGPLLVMTLMSLIIMVAISARDASAATTIVSPDYRKPILAPASQTNAWTSVVPNALASYFTYVPYRTADAVKLGFPSTCGRLPDDPASTEDCYTITARKFPQQLALPGIFGGGAGLLDPAGAPFGAITNVFGYGSGGVGWAPPGAPAGVTVTGNAPTPFATLPPTGFTDQGIWHFPAPSVKATKGRPVRITWLNELPNEKPTGFDPTICDNMPMDCFPYNRLVTHVHGAHVTPESDGFANSWFSAGFAVKGNAWESTAQHGPEGTYRYPMDQEAGTIWYHDHAMGLTHDNTNMGLAGFFPITDDNEKTLQGLPPGSAATKVLPTGDYELGFALQDRVFYSDGQLAMPDTPIIDARDIVDPINLANPLNCTYTYQPDGTITPNDLTKCTNTPKFMKDLTDGLVDHHLIPYVAGPGVQPLLATSSTLEFFGNMPVVNGVVYGKYNLQPRVYRMRFIGGTDSRTFIMRLKVAGTGTDPVTNPARYLPFWQIGTEQGFLNNPVKREHMVIMGGERLDVLVDFNGAEVLDDLGNTVVDALGAPIPLNLTGKQVILENWGADSPYDGVPPLSVSAAIAADAAAIAAGLLPYRSVDIPEIMVFDVSVAKTADADVPTPNAATVLRNAIQQLTLDPAVPVRKVSLWEITDQYGRIMPTIDGRGFGGEITELIRMNDIEQWDIINTTVDAHPMHLHQVAFQLINREDIQVLGYVPVTLEPILNVTNAGVLPGPLTAPDYVVTPPAGSTLTTPAPYEAGWKDTIMCPPGKVTRVKAKFDIPGMYVWHCHILSHEEHDMMRPFVVTTPAAQVTLTASSTSQTSGTAVTPVTFSASTTTSIAAYPNGSGFEYQFSVTPPAGVTVTQPAPSMASMIMGSTPGFSLIREAIWTPPTVPGTYVVTVNAKALGAVSATNPLQTASLNFIVAGPSISGATSTTGTGFYKAGTSVNVSVAFNQAITSTGLAIALNNGVTINTGALTNVSNFSGSFTVAAGQNTPTGQFLNITGITGTITDAVGNAAANPAVPAGANIANNVSIVTDTVAPTSAAAPPAGTYGSLVNVALTANETATIYYTIDGTTPTTAAGSTTSIYTTPIVLSSPTTATKTVKFFAVDQAGNIEAAVNTAVYNLHTSDLVAKVALNNGKGWTNSLSATLSMSASDKFGVAAYAISTDNITYLPTVAINPSVTVFSATVPVTLPSGDGLKTVYVKFTDGLGVVYPPVSAQINLETALPIVNVTPAGGDYAGKITVSLSSPNEPEGATIYYTTDGSTPAITSKTTRVYTTPFTLSGMSTTTTTTITVKYFAADLAGNVGTVQSSVYRFVANPDMLADVNINNDAPYTNTRNVLLKVKAQDPIGGGVATMAFSNDGVNFTTPVTYVQTNSMPWTLTPGDALKTVYFRFTDKGTPGVAPITYTFTAKIFLAEGVKLATGDVDGNGKVDLTDAYLALMASSGLKKLTIAQQARGDVGPLVNGKPMPDGAITSGDAVVIIKKSIGLVSF